ncbi:MAG TPA: cystathionine beta-synthase [Thermoleophilia bacterium]|nr:cystathionine beta-synthase [Thermoleophilia bacterium]
MEYRKSVLELIGETPLVELSRVGEGLPVTLLAKIEYVNPGGSVKDRIGLAMVVDAEERGLLRPGGTIIEATAGNTGVGLALAAAVKGYRCIFVLPDKMSEEKVNLLKAYGAEIVITPAAVPPDSPESYNGVADRLAREIAGSFRPSQFTNHRNPGAHYLTTGPEIWRDTDGAVDVFVAGIGTGGTISGVGRYLKELKPEVVVVGADPEGSILSGDAPRAFKVEGIGEDFIPATFDRQVVDEFVRVGDGESFDMARRLAREEGLLVGGSAGAAVAAAVRFARRLELGKTIVVLLPDTGRNYLTKFFSDRWMEENHFAAASRSRVTAGDVLRAKSSPTPLIAIDPDEPAIAAVSILERHGISQIPVLEDGRAVGSVNEVILAKALHDDIDLRSTPISSIMGVPMPQVDDATDVSEPYRLLLAGHCGVLVTSDGRPFGFLARIDLVDFWTRQKSERSLVA